MPGIVGAIGCAPQTRARLRDEFERTWPSAAVESGDDWMLGAHSHHDTVSLIRGAGHSRLAVDGEWALYGELESIVAGSQEPMGTLDVAIQLLEPKSAGNVARLSHGGKSLRIDADSAGSFPLFYSEVDGGLLFCSLQRALAVAIDASRDDLGTLQYLRDGYVVGARTLYHGVRRLLPGQSLRYAHPGKLQVVECSDAWSQVSTSDTPTADEAWSRLVSAVRRSTPDFAAALMMSGGWDSRTLLGASMGLGRRVSLYSHGDLESREIRIVKQLARASESPVVLEPIDGRVLVPAQLQAGFARTESVVFPHWHHAGRVLAEHGMSCVSAGVFGEILGGHYGPAMLKSGAAKVAAVALPLLGLEGLSSIGSSRERSARDFLYRKPFSSHWYLRPDFDGSLRGANAAVNTDIDAALDRLTVRGVSGQPATVEAFVAEHRGCQYINAQILSCRGSLDVSLPFSGRELFPYATRIPLSDKIHNVLNRRMLAQHAPGLLAEGMAATLVPASMPVVIQEASRLARKVLWEARGRLRAAAGREAEVPRSGWVNFEFLRSSRGLLDILDDLRCDFWDRDAIARRVSDVVRAPQSSGLHPLYDQFGKIYTADLLLRR